jgi:hypothetical protein
MKCKTEIADFPKPHNKGSARAEIRITDQNQVRELEES